MTTALNGVTAMDGTVVTALEGTVAIENDDGDMPVTMAMDSARAMAINGVTAMQR